MKRHLVCAVLCLLVTGHAVAASCPVRFLGPAQSDELDEGFRDLIIPRTGDYQKAIVQTALDAIPPILCAAVGRVVFVHAPHMNPAVAFTNTVKMINDGRPADLIYFNNAAMPEERLKPFMVNTGDIEEDGQESNRIAAIHAVIHEAVHVADHLLDSQRRDSGYFDEPPVAASHWSGAAVSEARAVVEANMLKSGFRQEWARIHAAFVKVGMARDYYGKTGGADLRDIEKITGEHYEDGEPMVARDRFGRTTMLKPAPIELAAAGFMTQYGGTQVSEDIAELAAGVLTRQYVKRAGGDESELHGVIEDHACGALLALPGPSIPTDVAAMYTKLGFLQSTGFITEEGYLHCVGELEIRGAGAGFQSYKSDNPGLRYGGDVRASVWKPEGDEPIVFEMSADGTVGTTGGDVAVTVTLILNVSPEPGLLAQWTGGGYGDLDLDDVSLPRGIYLLGYRHGPHNKLQIIRKDNGGKIMEVGQGLALIGRASRAQIEGSLFVQRYFNFSGGLLSAIAADEPVKEPTSITFRRH